MRIIIILLAGCAFLATPAVADAQDAAPAATFDAITVTGERRGSAVGGIPPENVLSREDVRATGATDIGELLEALAPQIGSARGRGNDPAILLLDGQRVSSFRELRDLPTDAIERVEILPEAVALGYGYRADQRVVNVVLKQHFRSTAGLLRGETASGGSYAGAAIDLTRVTIGEGVRTTFNLRAEGNSGLTENERDIHGEDLERAGRSLIGAQRDLRGGFTHYRRIGAVGVTGNLELRHSEGRAMTGLGETVRAPLARDTALDSFHAGLVLNGRAASWHWSVTGNADASREVTETDREADGVRGRAVTRIVSGDLDTVANGPLFRVPAGEAGTTIRVGTRTLRLDGGHRQRGVAISRARMRTGGEASVSLDLPISRRDSGFAPVSNLLLNGNAGVERLSDFGTLTTLGAGLYWSPLPRLDLTVSWTREEGAPTLQQLGESVIEAPGSRLVDFTTGSTVLATVITGGNPGLGADRRNVVLLGANWKPFAETDFRLRADFIRAHLIDPVAGLPGPTPAVEAAFPGRFVRNAAGDLISADLRPLNSDSARRSTLRLGLDLTLRLAPRPQGGLRPPSIPEQDVAIEPFAPTGGPRPVRTLFSPDDGRHLSFSLTDTVTFVDEMTIRDGLKLDYLRGDAIGQTGGRPRHEIEGRAGYHSNGIGGFLSASWRSGTRVTTADGSALRFAPHATFDVRLFVNLGQRPGLVSRHPWLEGVSIHLEVTNLFNARPQVRDASGNVPSGFERDLLDPLGRTIGLTLRLGGGGIGG